MKRFLASAAAVVALAGGSVVATSPAEARDSGWNETRVGTVKTVPAARDSGWNGT